MTIFTRMCMAMAAAGSILMPCVAGDVTTRPAARLYPVYKDGKVGFVNNKGQMITPFMFSGRGRFSDGFTAVRPEGKWGYLNEDGKLVIPASYSEAYEFNADVARVKKGADYYYIGKDGNVLTGEKYDDATDMREERAWVKLHDQSQWTLIDKKGNHLGTKQYEKVSSFSEGLAAFGKDGRCGYVSKEGKEVIAPKFAEAESFQGGLAVVAVEKDGLYGYIDKTGSIVIPCMYFDASEFSEGLAAVSKHKGEFLMHGLIDRKGKVVVDFKYESVGDVSEGLVTVSVWKGTKEALDGGMIRRRGVELYGAIDKTGRVVIPLEYQDMCDFHGGLALVKRTHGEDVQEDNAEFNAYIDRNNKVIWSAWANTTQPTQPKQN